MMIQRDKTFLEKIDLLQKDFEFLLSNKVLGAFQQKLDCDNLVFQKSGRIIGSCYSNITEAPFEIEQRIESIEWYGYKETYRDIGMALFSLLFSSEHYLEINILHPNSAIQKLFIHFDRQIIASSFLKLAEDIRYESFEYFRLAVSKFPFSGEGFSIRSLPDQALPKIVFGWSSKDYNQTHSERIKNADQLIVSLTADGLYALGSLFLDISALDNEQNEICLESPSLGFGGVSANSIESRFWLPNSFGFYTESLDDLKFC